MIDVRPLQDLITVLVWYATEGHCNSRNGGVVITQANRDELERVQAAYSRITTGQGSIDAGAKTDSAGGFTWARRPLPACAATTAANCRSTSGCLTSCSACRLSTCSTLSMN